MRGCPPLGAEPRCSCQVTGGAAVLLSGDRWGRDESRHAASSLCRYHGGFSPNLDAWKLPFLKRELLEVTLPGP